MGVIVRDSFDRADTTSNLGNAETGQAYLTDENVWGIIGNKAYSHTFSSIQTSETIDCLTAQVKMTCSITTSTTHSNRGLTGRWTDANNLLRLHLTNVGATVQLDLYKRIGGAFTLLQAAMSGAIALSTTYLVEWTMVGPLHVVAVDGVQRISVSDSNAQDTVTRHGLTYDSGGGSSDSNEGRWNDLIIETSLVDHIPPQSNLYRM